ncbi:MAG: ABC transporter permease [Pseudanabaena sp.]|jgi:ABC-2 type transport system permease protein|nr:ABC transporter permease [Pseudanabaena sp. M109S1SP2A07QC]MCA6517886.1 ABC transporter permease [Pseudanabaena sp. M110S1SP2A07QC]MCA6527153.1 ABC transporter permease [Pseudanabaena sp. M179S2SP2A07QC]MCA6528873.1 ABC transporter permease [Pseudanabaena sp. M125S2SP2A07QC]MCA6533378.1 ABC transporter permease [Pseudanabaena sp. M176S2SP2A07QC]MCA6541479.1 ABC transporter permease [Pseudanabaena sp. M037S2SP2A07QC]MCA6543776.1 ABC transporter permease [Pseudanabaena sp. M074S1SP2A07QC]MC
MTQTSPPPLLTQDPQPKQIFIPESPKPNFWSADFRQEVTALTTRLFIQLRRRPTTLIAGVLQPLMWLLLFGALFSGLPKGLVGDGQTYVQFLAAGIIVFTAFSSALNSGLPMLFDREFGFLNRILVAPLVSRFSIIAASAIFIIALSMVQTLAIVSVSGLMGAGLPSLSGLAVMSLILMLLIVDFTMLSLGLAFAMPGHQEMLAFIFLVNLPLMFSSTALAPLAFMPTWLQWIASLNPLSWAIEPIRYVYSHSTWSWDSVVFTAPWGNMTILSAAIALLGFGIFVSIFIRGTLRRGIA